MPIKTLLPLIASALLSAVLPAHGQSDLPDGTGKEIVQTACAVCHELGRTFRAGYTPEAWRNVIAMMMNVGAPVQPDQVTMVTDYLAKNFPERPKPPAVIIPGGTAVSIKEWTVPTPGSRPHDPLAAPDGSIWYSGQMANVLGQLDPRTGEFTEHHLPVPMSGPHGLVFDKSGNIWFTANFKGYIGKLDLRTGTVSEYPLPDPTARDPHTLVFDQRGTLWFTVQSANMVGRLTPESGEVKLVTIPTPKSQPYGMVVSSQGVPFLDEFGSNKVASIDPDTMAIHEYALPNIEARPRRITISSDDIVWYTDYGRGYLGRLDPKSGKVTEWPSPGGPQSRPYAITFLNGVIWYSESGVTPNTLVRFDPKTETFQTWAIPSGGGVVRNMMATDDGHLVLACSGVNGIALVEIK